MTFSYQGVVHKMHAVFHKPIQYYFEWEDDLLHINSILGRKIEIHAMGYECLSCHKSKKIFRQGFCFDCFNESPSAGEWIMKPELSRAHEGIEDRDLEYETKVQIQPHVVYLAWSGGLKVGVTRSSQMPTRWIDQGAERALPIIEVPNRYLAGITEVALKNHFSDKTNWRKMLQANEIPTDWITHDTEPILSLIPEISSYYQPNSFEPLSLEYPILNYPEKIQSLNLEKQSFFEGVLVGVKGQYLIFDDGTVWNVRSSEGYVVQWNVT